MVRKKVEGNEEQRRAAARRARREGEAPSARKETTGASKQRTHLPRSEPHDQKAAMLHKGKQQWSSHEAEASREDLTVSPPQRTFAGQESSDYTRAHEQVFAALNQSQQAHGGEGVYLDEIARRAGLSREQTRALLHDLSAVHRLVTQLRGSDDPDLGPRFEAKPRLLPGVPGPQLDLREKERSTRPANAAQ